MNEYLHIVCLDAPSPADYGGAIDMYYKIAAMASTGRQIILHYFQYNDNRNVHGLEKYCSEINAYERKPFLKSPSTLPYIVRSRINKELIARLNKDDHPVIVEGIHCSGIIPYLDKTKRVVIRMHNDEAAYYEKLASVENNFIRRSYYQLESVLLKKYYGRINKNIILACLSETDLNVMKQTYGFNNVAFIPSFIPWQTIRSKEGKGGYCLYHGNLSVSENEAAAFWLIQDVFSRTGMNFVIAGKQIPKQLQASARMYNNIKFVNNPSDGELTQLIQDAQINVLPSLNSTGVKFKLLHALFEGRFCISNLNGIQGSQINPGVHLAETATEYITKIGELFEKQFSTADKKNRQHLLTEYDNLKNAERLSALL